MTLSSCWWVPSEITCVLCLIFIKLQAIAGHPVTNLCDARRQTMHCFMTINSWSADVNLCVVGIRVTCETALGNDIEQLRGIQQE